MNRPTAVLLAALVWGTPAWAQDIAEAIARGDDAWQRRGEGHVDGRAVPGPIGEAVAAYEEALAADPSNLEAIWKLLRSLYFQGDYTTRDNDGKKRIFGRGREVAEAALDLLAERVGGRKALDKMAPEELAEPFPEPEVARIYFWATANWGLWGQAYGKMAAARQGVAGKVRDWTEVVLALDPGYDEGGGYRVRGRLHTEAPKIPFITGWVDHKSAIVDLRHVVELYPGKPLGRLYLADALLRFDKRKKDEALAILRELAELQPRTEMVVEDYFVRREARKLLAAATR